MLSDIKQIHYVLKTKHWARSSKYQFPYKEINVVVEKDIDLQKLNATITAIRNDNTEFVQYYDLWINTINAS